MVNGLMIKAEFLLVIDISVGQAPGTTLTRIVVIWPDWRVPVPGDARRLSSGWPEIDQCTAGLNPWSNPPPSLRRVTTHCKLAEQFHPYCTGV
jgi:hypothetical protein